MALTLTLNGASRTFDELNDRADLAAIIHALGLKSDRVAIEHNGQIVPRSTWPVHSIASGDKLELVHFVGGGFA